MGRPAPLALESLENRLVPATFGNPWPDAPHLTLSFAPDGTAAADRSSVLFQTLGARVPTAVWEREALRAFQTWAVNANINLGLVADGGEPLGTVGRPQGDSRFGDVRLAAYPMSGEVVAVASPFDAAAGTYAGDVKINSAAGVAPDGAGQYDLFTVLLHEAGHVFGLDHSPDPTSAMFEQYLGPRTRLSAGDVAGLQSLYGARAPDAFEGLAGNGTLATASPLNLLQNPDGTLGIRADADVSSLQDADVYRFQAPLNLGGLTVTVRTAGISLLTPRATVYDGSGRVVASAVGGGPLGGDLSVRVPGYQPLGTYYVKVESGSADVFGVGSYRLEVQAVPLVGALTGLLTSTAQTATGLLANSLPTNGSILTASLLPPLFTQTDSHFAYAFKASISDRSDVDYYRIQAPQPAAGGASVLSVLVWGLENNGLAPAASVYDGAGNPVSAEVLTNENGTFTLQVPAAVAGATYFVKVQAADPSGPHNVGNYFLGIDFGPQATELRTVTSGNLDVTHLQDAGALTLTESQLMHLVVSVNAQGHAQNARVLLTVTGADGAVRGTAVARDGLPASLTAFLRPGAYAVRLSGFTSDGQPLVPLAYTLKALGLSDPIGPEGEDTTQDPQPAPPPGSSGTTPSPPPNTGSNGQSPPPPPSSSPPPPGSPPPNQPPNSGSSAPPPQSSPPPNQQPNPPPPPPPSSSASSGGQSPPPNNSQSAYAYWYAQNQQQPQEQSGVSSEDPSQDPYTTN